LIYEQQGDLEASIEYLNKFLDICEETKNKVKAGQAHKKLAETYQKSGNIPQAIKHLEKVLALAMEENNGPAKANAALKLGLLYYQEGDIKRASDYMSNHFDFLRGGEDGTQNQS